MTSIIYLVQWHLLHSGSRLGDSKRHCQDSIRTQLQAHKVINSRP